VLQVHGVGADNREDARYQHPTSASHRSRRSRRLGLLDVRYCQRGLVVRANLKDGMSRAHRADAWPRCADDPVNRRRRSTPRLLFLDEEADLGAQATMMDCGC
jgi:hypothetical protein